MKHLATLLALLLSCSMFAQGPVEFPWNPDADGDDFIGVNDLMALLGEFDSVFSEEALYLSEDSLSAMYFAGDLRYMKCQQACFGLPGKWTVPKLEDVVIDPQEMWLRTAQDDLGTATTSSQAWSIVNSDGQVSRAIMNDQRHCFCVTKERPKVEYSYCEGPDIQDCAAEKVEDGWYPLGGITTHENLGYSSSGYQTSGYTHHSQAFWRWAE